MDIWEFSDTTYEKHEDISHILHQLGNKGKDGKNLFLAIPAGSATAVGVTLLVLSENVQHVMQLNEALHVDA